jgi:metal-sulfur cluster biosynthetic enzyme
MTLTSQYCPAGEVILAGIKAAAETVAGVVTVDIKLVWEPAWTPDLLSAAGRKQLGWDSS